MRYPPPLAHAGGQNILCFFLRTESSEYPMLLSFKNTFLCKSINRFCLYRGHGPDKVPGGPCLVELEPFLPLQMTRSRHGP